MLFERLTRRTGRSEEEVAQQRPRRREWAVSPAVIALLTAFCAFLVIGSLMSVNFAQQVASGISAGATYSAIALAIVIIYRATEVANLAQGEMAMFTTFIAWQFIIAWGWPYWIGFFVTLVVAFALGVTTERIFIRPVEGGSIVSVAIVTVGLFLFFNGLAIVVWNGTERHFPPPAGLSARPHDIGGVAISDYQMAEVVILFALVLILWLFFQFTKVGLAMRAAAFRPANARLVGVRVTWMLALGWGLAAMFGAVAGMLTAPVLDLSPQMMLAVLLYAFVAAVAGGLESPAGAVVGGLILGVLLNLLSTYVNFIGSVLRLPAAMLLLLIVLLIKPSGLFGRTVVRKV